MNKNIIHIGSLCIIIILISGLLYSIHLKEGFVNPILPPLPIVTAAATLTKAKQSIADTNTAIAAANKATGSSTESLTAQDAFKKANTAVADSNSAVTDTKNALGDLNITELEKIAATAKTNLTKAEKDAADRKAAADNAKAAADTAVTNATAKKSEYEKADAAEIAAKKNLDNGPKDLYKAVGCFADQGNRAIPLIEGSDVLISGDYKTRPGAIDLCYKISKQRGMKYFGVQDGGHCAAGNDLNSAKKYGPAGNCSVGKGGPWANDVYEVVS